jgi:hypothetical protein
VEQAQQLDLLGGAEGLAIGRVAPFELPEPNQKIEFAEHLNTVSLLRCACPEVQRLCHPTNFRGRWLDA